MKNIRRCLVVNVGNIAQFQGSKYSLNCILLKLKLLYLNLPYYSHYAFGTTFFIYSVYIFEPSVYAVRSILERNR